MRRRRTILHLGIGMLLVGLLFWTLGWREIVETLVNADRRFVVLGFTAASAANILWALNWRIFLDNAGYSTSIPGLLRLFYAATFINNITPLGELGGEPLIAYVVSSDSTLSYEESFAAVLSASVTNTVPFFLFSIFGVAYFMLFNPFGVIVSIIALLIGTVFLLGLGLVVLLWFRQERTLGLLARIISTINTVLARIDVGRKVPMDEVIERVESFYSTLHGNLMDGRSMLAALIVAHCGTFLVMLGLYTFLLAVGWKVPFFYVMFIIPIAGVASYMPMPGGLGGIEATLIGLLVLIAGVPPAVSSAAVILQRGTLYGLTTIIGAFALWYTSISLDKGLEGNEKTIL